MPLDLADPAAIEEADTRGLITFDSLAGGVQVRLAHPLLGQIRRKRAPMTKLRRLRGLVAAEDLGQRVARATSRIADPDGGRPAAAPATSAVPATRGPAPPLPSALPANFAPNECR